MLSRVRFSSADSFKAEPSFDSFDRIIRHDLIMT